MTVTVTNTRTGEKQEVRPSWGLVAEGIRFLMYGAGVGSLPLQIHKAAQGDLAPLVQMSIERRLGITEGLYWGMDFSVTCAEDLPFITEEMIRARTPGTYLGDYRIRQQKAACKVWPRGKIPADAHEPVHSDVPVLLISGERDPVTPPEFAEQASRRHDEPPARDRPARQSRRRRRVYGKPDPRLHRPRLGPGARPLLRRDRLRADCVHEAVKGRGLPQYGSLKAFFVVEGLVPSWAGASPTEKKAGTSPAPTKRKNLESTVLRLTLKPPAAARDCRRPSRRPARPASPRYPRRRSRRHRC